MAFEEIVIVGDSHGKLVDFSVINHAADNFPKAAGWIVNGDIADMSEASFFAGWYPLTSTAEEHNFVVEHILNHLSEKLSKAWIKLNRGNHELRTANAMKHTAAPAAKLYGYHDTLSIMATGHMMVQIERPAGGMAWVPEKTYNWPNIYYASGLNAYVTIAGRNCLVLHAHKSLKLRDSMARLWMMSDFVLPNFPNARIVVQGHTHRQADVRNGAFRYIEGGCSCLPGEYAVHGGKSNYGPAVNGYVVLRRDTKTKMVDINAIEIVSLKTSTLFNPVGTPSPQDTPDTFALHGSSEQYLKDVGLLEDD